LSLIICIKLFFQSHASTKSNNLSEFVHFDANSAIKIIIIIQEFNIG